jgi:hypothetical protein
MLRALAVRAAANPKEFRFGRHSSISWISLRSLICRFRNRSPRSHPDRRRASVSRSQWLPQTKSTRKKSATKVVTPTASEETRQVIKRPALAIDGGEKADNINVAEIPTERQL